MEYNINESYPFRVKNVFKDYCELVDEKNGVRTYLQKTGNLKLFKSQVIKCRILENHGSHPKVELVDLTDIIVRKEAKIVDTVLTRILSEAGIKWNYRDFIRLMLFEDDDTTFESQVHRWIQSQISVGQDLRTIRQDCSDLLELSALLDTCTTVERELYQIRFTQLIEQLGYYIKAQELITDDNADAIYFIDKVYGKLRRSGFIYHPQKNFNIMSCLFVLKPELMHMKMTEIFDIIRNRDIALWKKEPFRSALIKMLEFYVKENETKIDKVKDNRDIADSTIQALAIQLLMLNVDEENDTVDYRLSSARICTIASYASMANSVEIVNMALNNLVGSKVALPAYNLMAVQKGRFPFFISNYAGKNEWKVDTRNIFSRGHIRVEVSGDGIILKKVTSAKNADEPGKNILPKELCLWKNMQVKLPEKPASAQFIGRKDIFRFKTLWTDIESDLFETKSVTHTKTKAKKRHKVGDSVNISILRQDTKNPDRFECRIEDMLGGEGYIMMKDIVGYTVNASVRNFLSKDGKRLLLAAHITEFEDGVFRFSMMDEIKDWAVDFYADEPEKIVCSVGKEQFVTSALIRLPGVTKDGISVSLGGLNYISGLKRNSLVLADYKAEGEGTFHINADITERVNEDFDICDAFTNLMRSHADGNVVEEETEMVDVVEDDVNLLTVADVRELIYMIDRISILEDEYINSYNYLAFARILCIMIGWEKQATYYKGRMDIIVLLHDFAVNDRVDENGLQQLQNVNAELFESNPKLKDTFMQLLIVSYIGKPEHNNELWLSANGDNAAIRELAGLVLSYNFVKNNNMDSQAVDIQNRIKNSLRLKGHESGLKMYGSGIEDKTTEYKTSIVFVADDSVNKANHEEQMKEILKVINSFLNTDGGTLYVGVNDAGMGVGVENDLEYYEFCGDRDKYQRRVVDAVANTWGNYVSTLVDVNFDADNTKPVLVVQVRPLKEGIAYEGMWYVRVGSTKRRLMPDEFRKYNSSNRQFEEDEEVVPVAEEDTMPDDSIQPMNTDVVGIAEKIVANTDTDVIATSQTRCNALYDGEEGYRPAIGYLQLLESSKLRKTEEYNWNPEMLTLAVYDEEKSGHLVMVYDDGYVAKIPVDMLLDFAENRKYARFADANVVFASIAKPSDCLLIVDQEDKGQRRTLARIDQLSNIGECKLADHGERLYNEGIASVVLQAEIIPSGHETALGDILNMDKRSAGKPTRTMKQSVTDVLQNLGVKLSV